MNDEKWDKHINKWRTQIMNYKVDKEAVEMVERLTNIGEKYPERRDILVMCIKGILKPYPGFQYFRGIKV